MDAAFPVENKSWIGAKWILVLLSVAIVPYAVFRNSKTNSQYLIPGVDCDYSFIRSALHLSFVLPIAIGADLKRHARQMTPAHLLQIWKTLQKQIRCCYPMIGGSEIMLRESLLPTGCRNIVYIRYRITPWHPAKVLPMFITKILCSLLLERIWLHGLLVCYLM